MGIENEGQGNLQEKRHLSAEEFSAKKRNTLINLAQDREITYGEAEAIVELAKRLYIPESKFVSVTENGNTQDFNIIRRGLGPLMTPNGIFWEYEFAINDPWETYSVLVKADINMDTLLPEFNDQASLVLRTDSGCKTGQVFDDKTCECEPQLKQAMEMVEQKGEGIIINIPNQDGRGMGLPFKLATLFLQQKLVLNANTVQAAELLTDSPQGEIDRRTYSGVIAILKFLQIPQSTSIDLKSNNKKKLGIFTENGYKVELGGNIVEVDASNSELMKHLGAKEEEFGMKGLSKKTKGNK